MSVKIKINWNNENAVSESVRIYRSDSVFSSVNLPAVLEEITSDVHEYEDLDVIEDQTYFYMLSTKLGELEVFTECYDVVAKKAGVLIIPKITAITSEVVQYQASNQNTIRFSHAYFNEDGTKLFMAAPSRTVDAAISEKMCVCSAPFQVPSSPSFTDVATGLTGRYISGVFFFKSGTRALIAYSTASGRRFACLALSSRYSLESAIVLWQNREIAGLPSQRLDVSDDGAFIFSATDLHITKHQVIGDIESTFTLTSTTYSNIGSTSYPIASFEISTNGLSSLIITGNVFSSTTKALRTIKHQALDFSIIEKSNFVIRGTAAELTIENNCNRFYYDHNAPFLLLGDWLDSNTKLRKIFVTTESWM